MRLRQFCFIATLLTAAVVSGSGPHSGDSGSHPGHSGLRPGDSGHPVESTDRSPVIDLDGLRDVEFGTTEQELTRRGLLRPQVDGCGSGLAGHEAVSPIFAEKRLVLLWVSPPVRTPEGVTDGTPLSQVRSSYPRLTRLDAPKGTYRFDGLLAHRGDRAYLFLHDGRTVQKTIAGYADYARALFEDGHGPC